MKNLAIKTLQLPMNQSMKKGQIIRFAFPHSKGKISKDELIDLDGLLIMSETEQEATELLEGLKKHLKL